MTKAVIGKNSLDLSHELASVHYHEEKLLARAMRDLIDGDNDTTEAQQILNELRTANMEEFAIHEKVVRGDVTQAVYDAQRLAAGGQAAAS